MTVTAQQINALEEEGRQLRTPEAREQRQERLQALRDRLRTLESRAVATAVLEPEDPERQAEREALQAEIEDLETVEERWRERFAALQAQQGREQADRIRELFPQVERAVAARHAALERIAFAAVKAYVAALEDLREQPEEAEMKALLTYAPLSDTQKGEVRRRLREVRNRGPAEYVGAELSDQIQRACGVGSPALAFLQGLGVPADSEPFALSR